MFTWNVSEALGHTLVRESFSLCFGQKNMRSWRSHLSALGTEQRAELESQRDLLHESRERKKKGVHVLFLSSPGVPVLPTQAQCHLFYSSQNQMVSHNTNYFRIKKRFTVEAAMGAYSIVNALQTGVIL